MPGNVLLRQAVSGCAMSSTLEEIVALIRHSAALEPSLARGLEEAVRESQRETERLNERIALEAALDRLRTRALAMQASADVGAVTSALFEGLENMGITVIGCSLNVFDKSRTRIDHWRARQVAVLREFEHFSFNDLANRWEQHVPAFGKGFVQALDNGDPYYQYTFAGDERHRFFIATAGLYGYSDDHRAEMMDSYPDPFALNLVFFDKGYLTLTTGSPLAPGSLSVCRRFVDVFDLAYTRFLDLKAAEAQAREARIEAALEKVRSRTLAMVKSDELSEASFVLFEQMKELGEVAEQLSIGIYNEKDRCLDLYATIYGSRWNESAHMPYEESDFQREVYAAWKAGRSSIVMDLQGEALDRFNRFKMATSKQYASEAEVPRDRWVVHAAFFSKGFLTFSAFVPRPPETMVLLERFARVFDLTYARFLDLQEAEAQAAKAKQEGALLLEEKKRSDALLRNILPEDVADELKRFGRSYARKYDNVSVLFADIKGFSSIAESLSPEELVSQLDECFRAFDKIVGKHGLEKIKTIGDAYVCAGGLPVPVPDHAVRTVRAALDMLAFSRGFGESRRVQNLPAFEFRIGIHSGPVVTGVVGQKKFTYDIWGDAVNLAARMEQHGEAGRVNVSASTYVLIRDEARFTLVSRGTLPVKGKGKTEMYFVTHS